MQEKVKDAPHSEFKWVGTRPDRPDGVDKVTGRAKFGADMAMQGQLVGKVLRSPHPHARIRSIDTSAAEKLPGVKAVTTAKDFNDQPSEFIPAGEMMINYRDVVRSVMAREKALYEGHPVAAVAAISTAVAKQALKLIKVDYEVLPHVIDVVEAMQPGAPLLHEDMFTAGVEPAPKTPSNVAKRVEFVLGDAAAGFKQADVVVERSFTTKPVHQGYIEPHAVIASVSEDGQADVWVTTQGHWIVRAHCARLLGWDVSKIRVTSSEIGGGFGGKTVVYLEPLALALSKKAGRPGEDGDDARGGVPRVRSNLGRARARQDRRQERRAHRGGGGRAQVPGGRLCRLAGAAGLHVRLRALRSGEREGRGLRRRHQPAQGRGLSRARRADLGVRRRERGRRDRRQDRHGPDRPAAQERGQAGHQGRLRPEVRPDRHGRDAGGRQGPRALAYPARQEPGPRRGVGLLVQHRRRDVGVALAQRGRHAGADRRHAGHRRLARLAVHDGGRGARRVHGQDPGGDRRHQLAGLQLPHRRQPRHLLERHGDRGGSARGDERGLQARRQAVGAARGCRRVQGRRGAAGRTQRRQAQPMSLKEIAGIAGKTGGPIAGYSRINAAGAAPSLATHIADVEVDPETGRVWVVRYTAIQDAGRAIHPSYVEGQYQGGVAQGIGWALNEEYIYGADGKMQNPGFLDYRVPVASDLPMIDTVIVEVPNPRHPYGVRGVGETPIVPPMATIANAVAAATGVRFTDLPMSPPKVLQALDEARAKGTAKI